jgi:hypothetical protein
MVPVSRRSRNASPRRAPRGPPGSGNDSRWRALRGP